MNPHDYDDDAEHQYDGMYYDYDDMSDNNWDSDDDYKNDENLFDEHEKQLEIFCDKIMNCFFLDTHVSNDSITDIINTFKYFKIYKDDFPDNDANIFTILECINNNLYMMASNLTFKKHRNSEVDRIIGILYNKSNILNNLSVY